MADMFSTGVLTRVIQSLIVPAPYLLGRYFPEIQTETSEEIHFDVATKRRRIAPFVSPLVAGKVVQSNGYRTNTFKPAYIKDARVFDSNRPLKRTAGEQIGGSLDPMNRMRLLLAQDLTDQIEMVNRRLEVMAAEALYSGKVTVTGEDYPTVVVDYGRDAALTVSLDLVTRWKADGSDPLEDLQAWSLLVLKASGAMPVDVNMTVDIWSVFRNHVKVKDRLNMLRITGNGMAMDAVRQEGGVLMGTIDGFNIVVYAGWFVDPADDTEKPIMPDGTLVLASPQIEGVRAFGAIRDEAAGFQAMEYFAKSWVENDPSVRKLLMQSAPLTVPYRPNATLAVRKP